MICNPVLGCFGASVDGVGYFSRLLPTVISLLLVIGIVFFLFTFLFGAIKYMTSGGNKVKIEEARQTLTNATIGVVILLGFFAILSFIECFFGIGLRTINIGLYTVSFGGAPVCR